MNTKHRNISKSKFFTPIFILAMFVLLIISTFAFRTTIELERSQEEITRSYQIKSELNYLNAKLNEASASQRDYLITDNVELLKPYEEARLKINNSFRRLEQLAQSSAEQADRLNDLKWSVKAAVYALEDVLAVEQQTTDGDAMLLKKIKDSNVLSRAVKDLVKEMIVVEDGHIREFKLLHLKQTSFGPFGSLMLILFALLALVLFYYQVNEDFGTLRSMNHNLELTNNELSSFNHITSHDLQEPLRKIETFASRLVEKDKEHLSEAGQKYLEKINASAANMRRLIQDLLLFSQTNKTNRELENTSLAKLLEDVMLDFEEELRSNNGKITIQDNLPNFNCIPFQMKQLFINLIGNSIKYAKPDVPVEIGITYRLVEWNKKMQPALLGTRYHAIKLTDNGIGFDPRYASKIFEVFERLHQKNEYSGSGIGLAICKKIVDNHDGAIVADGRPQEGAIFTIYLPA